MNKTKIAITLDQRTVKCIDRLVREEVFPSRSQVIQEALGKKLQRIEHGRLAKECAKLDPAFEKAMAEEGMSEEIRIKILT